ncbi:unnamed protein product [marine sediment metagenome]|uniref:Uncharacterized protein n=1 Tax=marine sediment metagenome TaxID=412755 RepID=X1SWM2_9ZZZZ
MSTADTRAKEQAKAQLESIVDMVKRLEHARECPGDEDCKLPDSEICAGLNLSYQEGDTATEEEREEYHDEEAARQSISEDPLSVQVRSDWHTPGDEDNKPTEYTILLCTGGPACRIIGDLDGFQQPDTAKLEYQDWFTPWAGYHDATLEDGETLLSYAQQFYFGS